MLLIVNNREKRHSVQHLQRLRCICLPSRLDHLKAFYEIDPPGHALLNLLRLVKTLPGLILLRSAPAPAAKLFSRIASSKSSSSSILSITSLGASSSKTACRSACGLILLQLQKPPSKSHLERFVGPGPLKLRLRVDFHSVRRSCHAIASRKGALRTRIAVMLIL